MKTVLLALGMTACFGISLACLHLMLNYKNITACKCAKPKKSAQTKSKNQPAVCACSCCPRFVCRFLATQGGRVPKSCYVIVPALFLLMIVIMVWLAFSWEG